MAAQLNHTIVHSINPEASAAFMADILGLAPPKPFSHFMVVEAANGVSLDHMATQEVIRPQHYAFLVSEEEFDEIFGRIKDRKLPYWADPMGREKGRINTRDGGRGVYFKDPNGHHLEILTRPYGSGAL